jgi:serine/threonine protein kinase
MPLHRNVAHPMGIVWKKYDGTHPVPYYVLYRRAQGTLQHFLECNSPRPTADATLGYLADVLAALGHFSEHGFVHRDLKPDNVLLYSTKDASYAAIADFDCSRLAGANPTRGIGSKLIAAPETRRHETSSVSPQSDMWSFGCLCLTARWRLLASTPFAAADPLALLIEEVFEPHGYNHCTQQHVDKCLDGIFASRGPPEWDPTLLGERWIRQCLMLEPAARPPPVMPGSSDDSSRSQLATYTKRVLEDPKNPASWLSLGRSLRKTRQVEISGIFYSKKDCFICSLDLNYTSYAWNELGCTMGAKDVVQVGGVDRTQRDCFLEALRLNPTSSTAWSNLGHMMGAKDVVQVGGVDRTKQDCNLEALRLDPTNSAAWNNLGHTMGTKDVAQVGGVDRTKQDCFLEALRLDPTNFIAWSNLGTTMGTKDVVQVGGVDRTERDCFLEALRLDPTYSSAWNNLGATMGRWINLGHMMGTKDVVKVGGVDRTQRDCYLEALRLDPTNSVARGNLDRRCSIC